jgi:outer membrane protein TolC
MLSLVHRAAAALLLAAALCSTPAATLGLDEALRLAEQRSRQLPAHDAAAHAAREMAVAAGQRPDPVLQAGVTNLPADGPDRFALTRDFMTMRSIGLMQMWTREDKLRTRSVRFEREAEVAEANRRLALAALRRDTAIAWLERRFQERLRDALLQQRSEARLQVQAADAAYRGARGPQADVFAARSAVAQIDDRLAAVERDLATAKTQLARWVGEPAASEPLAPAPAMDSLPLRDEDLDRMLARLPQIEMLGRQEAVAQAAADAARSEKQPDVTVELMYSQRGPAYSNMLSFNVSVPLQWDQKQRQDRELAARLADVEQARAQREEAQRALAAEIRTMQQQWRSGRERLQRYDAELLPLAAERTRAALATYRGGSGPLAMVLDARRAEIDTGLERLRLELDTARLWAQLNHLIPGDTR